MSRKNLRCYKILKLKILEKITFLKIKNHFAFFLRMPRPPQMASLLQKLIEVQNRLHPYLEKYRALMASDSAPSTSVSEKLCHLK